MQGSTQNYLKAEQTKKNMRNRFRDQTAWVREEVEQTNHMFRKDSPYGIKKCCQTFSKILLQQLVHMFWPNTEDSWIAHNINGQTVFNKIQARLYILTQH